MNDFDKPLMDIIAEQNKYLNEHGGLIPKSTLIDRWHNMDNDTWANIFLATVKYIKDNKLAEMNRSKVDVVLAKVDTLRTYLLNNWNLHHNVCNPNNRDTKVLQKQYGNTIVNTGSGKSVKSELWQAMRNINELYNQHKGIDINNSPGDKGKYPKDWNGLDPDDTAFGRFF